MKAIIIIFIAISSLFSMSTLVWIGVDAFLERKKSRGTQESDSSISSPTEHTDSNEDMR